MVCVVVKHSQSEPETWTRHGSSQRPLTTPAYKYPLLLGRNKFKKTTTKTYDHLLGTDVVIS